MAALRDRLEKKIIPVSQQIRKKPTPTVTYPEKIFPTLVVEDSPRFAPITRIWFEILENYPPTQHFAQRKKWVLILD